MSQTPAIFFLRSGDPLFDEILKIITPVIANRFTNVREAAPRQHLSITLRCVTTGSSSEEINFASAVGRQSNGIVVMETYIYCSADRRAIYEYCTIVHRLFSVFSDTAQH